MLRARFSPITASPIMPTFASSGLLVALMFAPPMPVSGYDRWHAAAEPGNFVAQAFIPITSWAVFLPHIRIVAYLHVTPPRPPGRADAFALPECSAAAAAGGFP